MVATTDDTRWHPSSMNIRCYECPDWSQDQLPIVWDSGDRVGWMLLFGAGGRGVAPNEAEALGAAEAWEREHGDDVLIGIL